MLMAGSASAASVSGKQLLSWCQADDPQADFYISAFNDTAEMVRGELNIAARRLPRNASLYDSFFHRYVGRFCLSNFSAHTTGIVCDWLSIHHDVLSKPAPGLIAQSYRASFPCLDE